MWMLLANVKLDMSWRSLAVVFFRDGTLGLLLGHQKISSVWIKLDVHVLLVIGVRFYTYML